MQCNAKWKPLEKSGISSRLQPYSDGMSHFRSENCLKHEHRVHCVLRISCSGMCTSLRGPESPRLLRGEAPRKRGPGGSKDARESIGLSTRLRIATWNCAGLANLTMTSCKEMDFDIVGITETYAWEGDPTAIYLELRTRSSVMFPT